MLFGCKPGHGHKPVREMSGSPGKRPVFHGVGDNVCQPRIQALVMVQAAHYGFIYGFRQQLAHGGAIKNIAAEKIGQ